MKKSLFLFFLGVLALVFVGYRQFVAPELKTKNTPVLAPAPSRMPSLLQSFSRPRELNDETLKDLKTKMHQRFRSAGLSDEKSQAMFQLNDFHQDMPSFTEDNIRQREAMLESLNQNPRATVDAFKKLISEATPDEEALRAFLINITMNLDLSDEEKAEIFSSRIIQGAKFRNDGTVEDNELSMVIALTHLVRTSPKVRNQALENILDAAWLKEMSQDYMQLLRDYFPDQAEKINQRR